MFEEIEAVVSGKVQGVMYRDFVQTTANAVGVVGEVENRADGTVRVIAQGTPDALKQLIERLSEGSVLARVEDVAVSWRSPTRAYDDFSIIYL